MTEPYEVVRENKSGLVWSDEAKPSAPGIGVARRVWLCDCKRVPQERMENAV